MRSSSPTRKSASSIDGKLNQKREKRECQKPRPRLGRLGPPLMAWERASRQLRKLQGLLGNVDRAIHLNKEGPRGKVALVIEQIGRRSPGKAVPKWLLRCLCRLRWKARGVKSYAPIANSWCRFTVRSARFVIKSFTWIRRPKSRRSMWPHRTCSPSMKSSKKT